MKILKKFVLANLTFNSVLWIYQFRESALSYMTKNETPNGTEKEETTHCRWIDLTSATEGSKVGVVRDILYTKNRVDESFSKHPLIEKIDWEFKNCFEDFGKYFHDFRTYEMTKAEAFEKAITVCLLRVIKKHWYAGVHPELIYRSLSIQKRYGIISCKSPSKFYHQVKRHLRMGIYQGVLMCEARW